jgi:hypothetical protein
MQRFFIGASKGLLSPSLPYKSFVNSIVNVSKVESFPFTQLSKLPFNLPTPVVQRITEKPTLPGTLTKIFENSVYT